MMCNFVGEKMHIFLVRQRRKCFEAHECREDEEISTTTKVCHWKGGKDAKVYCWKARSARTRAEILKQQDESPRESVYDENRNLDLLGKEKGAKIRG